jgi:hypothetical protein
MLLIVACLCADDTAHLLDTMTSMAPYATISQRLRRTANRHRLCWTGFTSFERAKLPDAIQVERAACGSSLARMTSAVQPTYDAAFDLMYQRFGLRRDSGQRTRWPRPSA